MGGLTNRYLFSHSSGGSKSKIKVLGVLLLLRPLFFACRWLPSLCVVTWSSLSASVLISSFYKDLRYTGLEPILMTSFNLNWLFKGLISKYTHILRYWGLGLQHMNCGGPNSAHNKNGLQYFLLDNGDRYLKYSSSYFSSLHLGLQKSLINIVS